MSGGGDSGLIDADAFIVFMPSGRRGRFPHGTPILQAARSLGVDIDSVCGGRGICGRCRVQVADGDFAKLAIKSRPAHLSPISDQEVRYEKRRGLAEGHRLSCSTRLYGDVLIDVPPESQLHRQVVRKRTDARTIETAPILRLCYLDFADARTIDADQLRDALKTQWDLDAEHIDPTVVAALPAAIAEGENKVTVGFRDNGEITAIWPGLKTQALGLSIDIGSTTVAAQLSELASGVEIASAGMMNPQIRFGEDVMSRVSYIMMNPESAADLTRIIREALNQLAKSCVKEANVELTDICEVTIVGNPIMHHIFLGLDAIPLGQAPFPLAEDGPITKSAEELDLQLNPGARVFVLPCIAGHVGADTSAVILSEEPHNRDEIMLIVDIGTNAEIVLGNNVRLMACSSPTGPALEGAQISCGQRAAPGAIERLRIDPTTLQARFKVIGSDKWSDETGFDADIENTGITGICGSGIIEAIAELYLSGVATTDGLIDGAKAKVSQNVYQDGETYSYLIHDGAPKIFINQTDVRNVQLAKAAAYAGARLLMSHMGIDKVDRITLTGAFGSFIDPKYAMVLGLIPDCNLDLVSAAGNAAGTGARIALLNSNARNEIAILAREVEKIETALDPQFQEEFVNAMAMPHKTHGFPELAKIVALPASTAGDTRRKRQGRKAR